MAEVHWLLCASCNLGLGYFKDDAERMANAVAYIKQRGK